MTIQEEIRAGVANIIADWFMPDGLSGQTMPNERSCIGDIWDYLHSQGVVIKVERKLPFQYVVEPLVIHYGGIIDIPNEILQMSGYVAVEPLIGEK